jgi:hypothetical protein
MTRPESPATSTARMLDEYAAHLRSLPARQPFPLATDAPSAPPVRVRALEPLPFPLVRRVVWTTPAGATEPVRRVLVVR